MGDDERGRRGSCWYFAFGANMDPGVFRDRRGMRPLSAEPAVLRDHALVFDQPGIPLIEPAFANIRYSPGDAVHGVLYCLPDEELALLDRSEAAGVHYERLELPVTGRQRGRVVACVYRSLGTSGGLRPSRRYRDLLVRGARAHDLPSSWVQHLTSFRPAPRALPEPASRGLIRLAERLNRRGVHVTALWNPYWRVRDRMRARRAR